MLRTECIIPVLRWLLFFSPREGTFHGVHSWMTQHVRSISPPVSTGTIFVGVPLCQERNDPKKTWACPTASLFYSSESAMGEVCTRNDPNTRISSEQYNNNKCNYYYYYDDDDGYGTATTIRLGGGPQQRHFTTTIIAATDGIHTTTTTIHHSY